MYQDAWAPLLRVALTPGGPEIFLCGTKEEALWNRILMKS